MLKPKIIEPNLKPNYLNMYIVDMTLHQSAHKIKYITITEKKNLLRYPSKLNVTN